MKSARALLDQKGYDIWSIGPDASVYDAIARMAEREVGALLVMQDSEVVGIVSERDYARKVILKGRSSRKTPVREVMTSQVVCTRADESIEECMALMTDKRIRHLPVLAEGKVIGIISIGDLVRAIIAEQRFVIEQLEQYISG